MVKMVEINKQSIAFCKYTIATLLWLGIAFYHPAPFALVAIIVFVSAITGVHRSPLVVLFDKAVIPHIDAKCDYINMMSMRFAHKVATVFSILCIICLLYAPQWGFYTIAIMFAVLQSIASFGYCSAAKLYECVVCNSNCCRVGKKVRKLRGEQDTTA